MRIAARICLIVALAAGLAACGTTNPRRPAEIEYRTPARGAAPAAAAHCGGGAYTVRSGDTLSEIAERCGVSMSELASQNGLYRPYTLRAGQTLTLPAPSVHVVQRGENLYRIGLRYGIDYRDLAAHNGIPAPYEIEVGDQIRLTRNISAPVRRDNPPSPQTGPRREEPRPDPVRQTDASFDWPIRGDIILRFGPRESGRRNDGINISARAGDSVRAAADGQVVYAGGELQGYGELILLRHENGFVTAYAHNRRLLVAEGQRVQRGDVIAEAGSTGSVDSPQVHFEIRRGTRPVDPMGYLR